MLITATAANAADMRTVAPSRPQMTHNSVPLVGEPALMPHVPTSLISFINSHNLGGLCIIATALNSVCASVWKMFRTQKAQLQYSETAAVQMASRAAILTLRTFPNFAPKLVAAPKSPP